MLEEFLRKKSNPRKRASIELVIGRFLNKLEEFDLIESREAGIIRFSLKWLMGEASSLRPESVFSLMMDEDSSLQHRDQLLGSLAVIELRKARSANWFYVRYRSILKQDSEKIIERFAAISRFLEIIVRSDSKIQLSFPERGSRISLKIVSQTPEERFPQKILGDSISELGNELDRFVEYKVKSAKKSIPEEVQTGAEIENLENEKSYDG